MLRLRDDVDAHLPTGLAEIAMGFGGLRGPFGGPGNLLRAAPVALAVALAGTGASAQAPPADGLDKVTFATNWVAEAEHGGFYQALADGTYAKYGLDVTILQGGPTPTIASCCRPERSTSTWRPIRCSLSTRWLRTFPPSRSRRSSRRIRRSSSPIPKPA
jgi:hypothetical protein